MSHCSTTRSVCTESVCLHRGPPPTSGQRSKPSVISSTATATKASWSLPRLARATATLSSSAPRARSQAAYPSPRRHRSPMPRPCHAECGPDSERGSLQRRPMTPRSAETWELQEHGQPAACVVDLSESHAYRGAVRRNSELRRTTSSRAGIEPSRRDARERSHRYVGHILIGETLSVAAPLGWVPQSFGFT